MLESYLEIQLDQEPIELCKLLKIADLVAGGGEAKVVISEGHVLLNGEVEYQKRKKIYHNDIVEFNGETLKIYVNENLEDEFIEEKITQTTQTKSTSQFIDKQKAVMPSEKKLTTTITTITTPNNDNVVKKNKRKPISF
jgi:ribosome-associated protein